MTREEEIKQAAKNRADQYEHPVDWNNCYHHYIQGAEWADKHPKAGLWDNNEVIKFIKENVREYHKSGVFHLDDFINDLRKAMED